MFGLLVRSKIFLSFVLLIHTTSIFASEIINIPKEESPYQSLVINGRDVIRELFTDDNTVSYDAVLMLLDELENGNLEEVCSEDDLCKINNFLVFLVERGMLPNVSEEDQSSLEKDVDDLLTSSEDALYENASYNFDSYLIIPCIYNKQCEVILCKSKLSKAWKKSKKFVKKHKKEIIIGAVVVVAAVAVVATVAILSSSAAASATAAGSAAAGVAGESNNIKSDKNNSSASDLDKSIESITKDNVLDVLESQISDYQNIIFDNNLLSPDLISDNLYNQDNQRIIGSTLAHESLTTLPPSLYEGYDNLLIQGHGIVDNAFSTNQTASYLMNNMYDSVEQPLKENIYYYQGKQALSIHSYDCAIEDFGKVLEINPNNSNVYLERAYTYFEMGDTERSLEDFKKYNELQTSTVDKSVTFDDCVDFSAGVVTGIPKGAVGSTKQLLSFAANAITHPIDTSVGMYEGFSNLAKLAMTQEWKTIRETLAPEVCELIDKWDSISVRERGERSGYIVGKYGADILLPTASAKAISQGIKGAKELAVIVKNLEKTERLMPLEALAGGSSEAFAEAAYSWKIAEESFVYSKQILNNIEFTQHAIERAIERNVSKDSIFEALKNPLKVEKIKIDNFGRPSQRYIGKKAEVVVNPETNQIVSVNPTSSNKANKLINELNND